MSMYRFAVVGATGMVGRTFLRVMEEKKLPVESIRFLSSHRSAGTMIRYMEKDYPVEELTPRSFDERVHIALFSAGSAVSRQYAPLAAEKHTVVIDNSSAWRMDPSVPLVVPEVNPGACRHHHGIIANPNCSTIQAVVVLKPLHDAFTLKRVVYSTYQAVSGAGMSGCEDLREGLKGNPPKLFPHPIVNNCIPHIDTFLENGYTKEEDKMIRETRKILGLPSLRVTSTTVRVPVFHCHSESINIEFEKPFNIEALKAILKCAPGIVLQDDPSRHLYPLAASVAGRDEVFVGRIRRDESVENGINLWVVADNIRKGAATNAIQIVQELFQIWKSEGR